VAEADDKTLWQITCRRIQRIIIMIRLILAVITLVIFLLFSIILAPVQWLIGKISMPARDTMMLAIIHVYVKILLFVCGVKVTVIGKERIPKDTAVLYTPNHRGMFDILTTLAYSPTMPAYISKKEWKKVPLLSWWITWMHGFYLDRQNPQDGIQVIFDAIEAIKRGQSVTVFPEGTRGRSEDEREMLPFHEGCFKIAVRTGCPIIPVSLNHTSQVLEDQFPRIRATHVIMEYGEPILPKQLSREERRALGERVQGIVQEMVAKNHHLVAPSHLYR